MKLSTVPVNVIEIPTITQLNELGCTILGYDFMYDMDYNNPRILDNVSLMTRIRGVNVFDITEDQRLMLKELHDIVSALPLFGSVILNPLSAD